MEDARGLLLAAKRADKKGMFTWIAADGWGRELKLVEEVEEIALGAITVELQSETVNDFDEYFKRLRLAPPSPIKSSHKLATPITYNFIINKRNIWFREYWQEVFQCRLPDDQQAQALAYSSYFKKFDNLNNQSDSEQMLGDQPLFDNPILNEKQKFYSNIEQIYENAYERGDKQLLDRLELFHKFKSHHLVDDYLINLDKLNLNRYNRGSSIQQSFKNWFQRTDNKLKRSKRLTKGYYFFD